MELVAAAPSISELQTVEVKVAKYLSDLASDNKLAVHLKDANDSLATSRATFKSECSGISEATSKRILKELSAAETAFRSANTTSEYDSARDLANSAIAVIPKAKAYAVDLDKWREKKHLYVSFKADPTKKVALEKLYADLLAAAQVEAAKGNFIAARAELAKFDNDSAVDSKGMQLAADYAAKLEDFKSNHIRNMDVAVDSEIGSSDTLKQEYTDAKLPAASGDFATAIKKLDDLIARIMKLMPLVAFFKRYRSQAEKTDSPLKKPIKDMQTALKLSPPDYAAAKIACATATPEALTEADSVMDMVAVVDKIGELKKLISKKMVSKFKVEKKGDPQAI